jgi:hypothetical protein
MKVLSIRLRAEQLFEIEQYLPDYRRRTARGCTVSGMIRRCVDLALKPSHRRELEATR